MKVLTVSVLVLILALAGCRAKEARQGGGGGPSPGPSGFVHGATGGPGSWGGPAMGRMDPDGIGPGTPLEGGGGGGGGAYVPAAPPPEDPNVNPINKAR